MWKDKHCPLTLRSYDSMCASREFCQLLNGYGGSGHMGELWISIFGYVEVYHANLI